MYSTGPVWFLLFLEIFAAILPDLIIKVLENLRDDELIRKEKEEEQSRIDRAKDNQRTKYGSKLEIGSIDGFHSGSAGSARRLNDDMLFRPVDNTPTEKQTFNIRTDKIFNSSISPDFNNNNTFELNKPLRKRADLNNSNDANNSDSSSKMSSNKKGQPNRNFSLEEIK